jgi:hypothetical protein
MTYIVNEPIYDFSDNLCVDCVAMELINTPEFRRLSGIKQSGITGLFTIRNYSRAEHSFGVYCLLKYLGATLEQCVGGLLHDIYHTNFSHTTDELFCGESHKSFHEKNKYNFFAKCCSETIRILKNHFPTREYTYFLDGENMNITKNKSFGADMLDYFMRDGYYEGIISRKWIDTLITKLHIMNGMIILDDITLAKEFFKTTMYINDTVYMSPFSRGQYKIFTNILKKSLDEGIIMTDRIVYGYSSDMDIYRIIKENGSSSIQRLIQLLETATLYSYTNDKDKCMKKVDTKVVRQLRFLNPICGCCKVVSELDSEIGKILSATIEQYSKTKSLYIGTDMECAF